VRLGGILATDPEPDVVYAGVSRVILYPDYDDDRLLGDIALLQLSTAVSFTDTIRPVCLPPRDVDLNRFKVCVDTGFGRTNSTGQYSNILTHFSAFCDVHFSLIHSAFCDGARRHDVPTPSHVDM